VLVDSTVVSFRPTTVPEAVQAFKAFLLRRRRSPLTVKRYGFVLADFERWAGSRSPGSITTVEIDAGYLADWEHRFINRRGRSPSDQTVRARICALSSFYGYLSDYGLLVDDNGNAVANPMGPIDSPRIEIGPPDWLKPEEDERLLATPMDDAERIIVFLLRLTGMRIGEARALLWSDVEFEDGTISIAKSKFGKSRVIPIVPELLPHLRHWEGVLQQRALHSKGAPVLCTRNGTPMVPQHIEKLVARVGLRAELADRLNPHKLRKTFGSDLLNRGVRIEVVSALLGHSHVGITQRYYAQLLDATIRAEVLAVLSA
jgi:integrase/recombinase XerC